MLKDVKNIFSRKQKAIQDEISLKSKINNVFSVFLKEEILKGADIEYQLSYTVSKGVIRIQTDNKLIAQEIALRIKILEDQLKKEGVEFRKVLV